jgi:hypothetical protein
VSNESARAAILQEIRAIKAGKFTREGFGVLRSFRILSSDDIEGDSPEIQWQVCVDQSEVTVRRGGKIFQHPKYIDEQVRLRQDPSSNQWRVLVITSRKIPDATGCGKA